MAGEPVTQGIFFETIAQMRKDFEERHRHMRQDIQDGFDKIAEKMDDHAKEDRAVEKRVQRIEDNTDFKKEEARKAAAITSTTITGLVVVGWEVVKRTILGWK